ncbi:PRI1 primase, partial [Trogon melanurus]|nr:PRI1 primase [Trogon melanurus]
EDLGMRHRLWVYSGRRGVHCWVCDDAVRKWSPALRAAAVEYLTLVKVGAGGAGHPVPTLPRLTAVPPGRSGDREEGEPLRAHPPLHQVSGVPPARSPPPAAHREPLRDEFPRKRDSVQRWELLRGKMERTRVSGAAPEGYWEIMLQFCFPRLDINVSKGVGHLLKSPFSVHPKTGRISVPLDLQKLDQFDPFAVPTISTLCHELDAAGDDGEQDDGGETEPKRRAR